MLTISKENYLKAVYKFGKEGKSTISASTIAGELQVSNAAVTDMAKRLSEQGLLDYQKYKGLQLTKAGEKSALKVIRRHRLWEYFLTKVLDLSWAEVHDEAENLEHSTSEFLIDKMDAFLGFPKFDPHGSPIPDKNGKLPKSPVLVKMQDAEVNRRYQIARVQDGNTQLMNYLIRIGLNLHTAIKVIEKFSFDNSISIETAEGTFLLSEKVVEAISLTEIFESKKIEGD